MVRNIQCNPVCVLCDQAQETAVHLCLQCVFAREIWVLVETWTEGFVRAPSAAMDLEIWWNTAVQGLQKEQSRRMAYLLIYTTWNIWKERNRRVFEAKVTTPQQVLFMIKEEMKVREDVFRGSVML
ncbi:hypothetical protein HU200_049647 [Digitaria exilis]|uniref:Reverse transcriptase zinc-binding domain-containing protein n=1 Tax=Digitaria exilis TaxID=1010633 RepID=A0A835AQ66_9POAL|nr:hypothetical protein HU200_049647 [Digitaria exilis]